MSWIVYTVLPWVFLAPMAAADRQPQGARDVRYLILRYDDYAPQTPYVRLSSGVEVETTLFELCHRLAVKVVVGVIPFPTNSSAVPQADPGKRPAVASWLSQPQDPWLDLLRDYVARGTVDPALHGFQHRLCTPPGFRPGEFRGQTYEWQREAIRRGRDALAAAIDVSPKIFVPPWNAWDANTVRALSELGFGWCSADLHHAEGSTDSVRHAPQCTADPKELLAVLRSHDVPAGSIVVLVTHPFDFEGPNGRAYFQALEELLTFVSGSPQWRCVGLTDLPEAPIEQWNQRLRRAVTWDHTQQFLQDCWGPPLLLWAQSVVYRPLSWYRRYTWPWQLAAAATVMLSAASGGLLAWILARHMFTSRRLVWVAALVAGAGLIILILGAVSISRHDYLIRGVRWQAICVAAGLTMGLWTSGRRRIRAAPQQEDLALHKLSENQNARDSRLRHRDPPSSRQPELQLPAAADGCHGANLCTVIRRSFKLGLRAWQVGCTRLLWGWRLHALGRRSVVGRSLLVNNAGAVALGSGVTIMHQFVLADLRPENGVSPKIVIGDGTTILFRFQCNAAQSVTIGRNVLIAPGVFITDSDHVVEPNGVPVTQNRMLMTRPVHIQDNCWLGVNAVVLKGVTVGRGSIVGANSVVTRDVPPYSVVAGNPARLIRSLIT